MSTSPVGTSSRWGRINDRKELSNKLNGKHPGPLRKAGGPPQPARKPPMSPRVGRDMVAKLRAGKWYSAKTVAEDAGVTERDVHSVLRTMCWRPQHGARAERKKVGNEIHYRIFKQDKKVSAEELTTKLRPIVEGLKIEGKKNMATMVPAEVAMLAAKLERLLNEWAE
jgi:hypothetical protein